MLTFVELQNLETLHCIVWGACKAGKLSAAILWIDWQYIIDPSLSLGAVCQPWYCHICQLRKARKSIKTNTTDIADTGLLQWICLCLSLLELVSASRLWYVANIPICPRLWIPKQMTNYKQRKICRRRLLGWKSWDASGGEMQENATEKYRRRGREMQQRGENAGGGGAQIGTGLVWNRKWNSPQFKLRN